MAFAPGLFRLCPRACLAGTFTCMHLPVPVSERALVSTWQGKDPKSEKQRKRRPSERRAAQDSYLISKCEGRTGDGSHPDEDSRWEDARDSGVTRPRVRVPRGPRGAMGEPQKWRGAGVPSPCLLQFHPDLGLPMAEPPRGQRAKGSGSAVPGGVDLTRPGGHGA